MKASILLESLKQSGVVLFRRLLSGQEKMSERSIEYSFVFMNVGRPPATVLDVGCSGSDLPLMLSAHGFLVYGIDVRDYHVENPTFTFRREAMTSTSFPDDFFDIITAISTMEHLGLSGRYGIEEDDPLADKMAMKEVDRILKKDGRLILTVPYGRFNVFKPFHKVYDEKHLTDLISDFQVLKEEYFVRKRNGFWVSTSERIASRTMPYVISKLGVVIDHHYALACLVLKPK